MYNYNSKVGIFMLGNIIGFYNNELLVKLSVDLNKFQNIVNLYVIIQDQDQKYVGEIINVKDEIAYISLLGEFHGEIFIPGILKNPSFSANVKLISKERMNLIIGMNNYSERKHLYLGKSALYDGLKVGVSINDFFSNHFAILGATGSGKSSCLSRILQNLFDKQQSIAYKSSIFIFDAYGEYHSVFKALTNRSQEINFKTYTTNTHFEDTDVLKIPLWLLGVDDYALLLGAESTNQLPIIEKALKLVTIFVKGDQEAIKYKNDIIARSLLEILSSGKPSTQIRDQILSVLSRYNTSELNLETPVFQPGYTRPFRQCLLIDASGKIRDMELIISFVEGFLTDDYELMLPDGSFTYTLDDLKDAFDFALISEGSLKSEKVYDESNLLRIRLHSLANSKERVFFEYPEYVTKTQYIRNLLTAENGKKAQIINFSINYVDDRLAKNIVKIYSKLLFDYAKDVSKRNILPFHIFLEEAHRYIQNDYDREILGYNIFERISKEGRKYGVLLGLISQRPSELSETVLSQCSNFIIFRMVHPRDINYVKDLIPNMSLGWITKIKYLQPGTSICFGTAFNIPVMIRFEMPYPAPENSSCDLSNIWFVDRR